MKGMTAAQFRRLALQLPGAIESEHMNHPDFRVRGKIFASLGYPDDDHGMVILPVEEQAGLVRINPKVFTPAKGAWGKRGSTVVRLAGTDLATMRRAMKIAWKNRQAKN